MRTSAQIRQEITARIVESLTSGTLPPWALYANCGAHANVISPTKQT